MVKVNSIVKTDTREYILICNGVAPSEVPNIMATNIGDFSQEEFSFGRCTQCFSQNNCFAIRLHSNKDCMKIKSIDFR